MEPALEPRRLLRLLMAGTNCTGQVRQGMVLRHGHTLSLLMPGRRLARDLSIRRILLPLAGIISHGRMTQHRFGEPSPIQPHHRLNKLPKTAQQTHHRPCPAPPWHRPGTATRLSQSLRQPRRITTSGSAKTPSACRTATAVHSRSVRITPTRDQATRQPPSTSCPADHPSAAT